MNYHDLASLITRKISEAGYEPSVVVADLTEKQSAKIEKHKNYFFYDDMVNKYQYWWLRDGTFLGAWEEGIPIKIYEVIDGACIINDNSAMY